MHLDVVISESSPEKYVSTWMSFVILRIPSEGTKLKFREIEKVALKICLLNSHISLNETCMNNILPPTSTNIILHDDATHTQEIVIVFRVKLIERELNEQKVWAFMKVVRVVTIVKK